MSVSGKNNCPVNKAQKAPETAHAQLQAEKHTTWEQNSNPERLMQTQKTH
jgi:hypothetical protein